MPSGECGAASPCDETIQGVVDAAGEADTVRVAQGVYTWAGLHLVTITKGSTVTRGYTVRDWVDAKPEIQPTRRQTWQYAAQMLKWP